MRRASFLLSLASALAGLVPGYFGIHFLAQGVPWPFVGLLLVLSATALTGSCLLLIQGLIHRRMPDGEPVLRRLVSLSFAGALLMGAGFLAAVGLTVASRTPEAFVWSVSFILLAVVGLPLGVASALMTFSPGHWELPPAPEPILLPEEEDLEPMIPPEPQLDRLLAVKHRLQACGWR